jgi:hypothetical protein
VLVLVTNAAHGSGRLAMRGVGRRDVAVAVAAGRRLRALVVVRTMAVQALARAMHLHAWSAALTLHVAKTAVRSARHTTIVKSMARTLARESMTARAIGLGIRTESLASLRRGVLDARLLLVT